MGKVIKVIDLLNMIANGEEVPERIRVENTIFKYHKGRKDYIYQIDDDGWQNETLLFRVMNTHFIEELIDAKVEILDEEDEIDIQRIEGIYINDIKSIGISEGKCWTGRNLDIFLGNKINELLKVVKQLDNKLKEK